MKFEYEQAQKIFCSELIGGKIINVDDHGFSRQFEFNVFGENYKVIWYHNQSTLIINDKTHVMFHKAVISNTWPSPAGCKSKIQFYDDKRNCVCVIPIEFYE